MCRRMGGGGLGYIGAVKVEADLVSPATADQVDRVVGVGRVAPAGPPYWRWVYWRGFYWLGVWDPPRVCAMQMIR